jgi:TetR/AcrR family transcriptional regulator
MTRRPRRVPRPEERKLDAERSRRRLLDAALDEFAAKGYAGARVQDIADRAGLNKQLINYYFGGKEGLFHALRRQWLDHETTINDADIPLDELATRYLQHVLKDPRGVRMTAWRGLSQAPDPSAHDSQREDLSDLERRKDKGELGDELDPGAVMMLIMSAVSAPVVMPQLVHQIFGLEADSPEFEEHYAEQLRRIIRRLA